jgi:hypothetical protein
MKNTEQVKNEKETHPSGIGALRPGIRNVG